MYFTLAAGDRQELDDIRVKDTLLLAVGFSFVAQTDARVGKDFTSGIGKWNGEVFDVN